jgi:hypothetical protein
MKEVGNATSSNSWNGLKERQRIGIITEEEKLILKNGHFKAK